MPLRVPTAKQNILLKFKNIAHIIQRTHCLKMSMAAVKRPSLTLHFALFQACTTQTQPTKIFNE